MKNIEQKIAESSMSLDDIVKQAWSTIVFARDHDIDPTNPDLALFYEIMALACQKRA